MKFSRSAHFPTLLLALLIPTLASAASVGIRFVVDDGLAPNAEKRRAVDQALRRHVETLNRYYRDSQVDLRAEVVDVAPARIAEKEAVRVLDDMAAERGGFADLFARADEYGADYTVAVLGDLELRGRPGCGRAYATNTTREAIASTRLALAVMRPVCGAQTLAHELGHLMGLNHGAQVNRCTRGIGQDAAIAPYANGYAEGNCDGAPQAGEFGDIMVGGWMKEVSGDDKGNLPIFSNPRLADPRCGARGRCGDPKIGDAARALNENAAIYAGHEEPDVHVLPYADPALAGCIRDNYRGREIAELDELACPGRGIAKLNGIERLTALRRVDLSGNALVDVAALEALPPARVERINLAGNPRLDCATVERLTARFAGKVTAPRQCPANRQATPH